MTASTGLFTDFVASRTTNQLGLPSGTVQLNLALLTDMIRSATNHLYEEGLSREDKIWLIELIDTLKTEQETLEAKLAGPKEDDPLLGWHLHLRSQSGFELPSE